MKKGIITLAFLLSTFSFSKSNVIFKPYSNLGITFYKDTIINTDLGLDIKIPVYTNGNFEILVGGGSVIEANTFTKFNDKYHTFLLSNFSLYPLIEGRYKLNEDLGFYTNFKPFVRFGNFHMMLDFIVEPGISYKNFDFGLILGYKTEKDVYSKETNLSSLGFNLGLSFGYNLK